jgi:hypothetical protein
MTSRHIPRHVLSIAIAILVAVGSIAAPFGPTATSPVSAAGPDLTITSVAKYDVQPDKQRVRVTVDLTLTNHLKDTKTKRYYFDEAFLDVMPRTSGFKLTRAGSGSPGVKVHKRAGDYTRLRLSYPRLYGGKTARYRLTFDLKDPGGSPTRDLRVGDSLVSFPVWAFATDSTSGSSVTVVFPTGYEVDVEAGKIPAPSTDDSGRTIFRSGKLADPLSFFAYLVADRPGAYEEQEISPMVAGRPATLIVRSWPDDRPWAKRIGRMLEQALPALNEKIGLAWPHDRPLTVQEAVSRSIDGYAGLFDPRRGLVEIAYYADDFVVLHEAAHGWFNGALLADRWANEAFASYYAMDIADDLEVKVRDAALTEELAAARIPLNSWGPVGDESVEREDYAYTASLEMATTIADRAGDDGLARVWRDAADQIGAYQPASGSAETVGDAPDWRGLLDLLEARTDATYDDLWREYVARPTDLPLLDDRGTARVLYEDVVRKAADWRLPRATRDAMRAWRFDDATALLDEAAALLEDRAAIEAAATDAGLIAPAALRTAFEDDDGFDDAREEAAAELTTIQLYADAVSLRPAASDVIIDLGLWGQEPEADLVDARNALARGDLEGSADHSEAAATVWSEAVAVGQGRLISIGLLIAAAFTALIVLIAVLRRRRSRRREQRGPSMRPGSA